MILLKELIFIVYILINFIFFKKNLVNLFSNFQDFNEFIFSQINIKFNLNIKENKNKWK
jgi:hypothetical protein